MSPPLSSARPLPPAYRAPVVAETPAAAPAQPAPAAQPVATPAAAPPAASDTTSTTKKGNLALQGSMAAQKVKAAPDKDGYIWGPAASSVDKGTAVFMKGLKGPGVTDVQKKLAAAGHPVAATGKFDDNTKNAVAAFQQKQGLKPTGVVNKATLAALNGGAPSAPPSTPTTPEGGGSGAKPAEAKNTETPFYEVSEPDPALKSMKENINIYTAAERGLAGGKIEKGQDPKMDDLMAKMVKNAEAQSNPVIKTANDEYGKEYNRVEQQQADAAARFLRAAQAAGY